MNQSTLVSERSLTKTFLMTMTLITLLCSIKSSTVINNLRLSRGVRIERNLLVFTEIELPNANYSISGLEEEYVSLERERRLQITENPEFHQKLRDSIFKVMNGNDCSLRFANHQFFVTTLVKRLKFSLEKNHLDTIKLTKALKKLGKVANKKSQRTLYDNPKKLKKIFETDSQIQKSFNKVMNVIQEGINNRLKAGIVKNRTYSEKKLRQIIANQFYRLCNRDSVNEKGRHLQLANYFLESRLAQTGSTDQSAPTLSWSQHQTEIMKDIANWAETGALNHQQVTALSQQIKSLLLEFLNTKLSIELRKKQMQNGMFGGEPSISHIQNLHEVASKLDNIKETELINRKKFIQSLIEQSKDLDYIIQNDLVFIKFAKQNNKTHFKDLKNFLVYLRSFLKRFRNSSMISANQSNQIINSARKLYLRDQIDKNKFNYQSLKKGILIDLKARKDERLHWKLFMNILNKNLFQYKTLLDGFTTNKKSSWKKVPAHIQQKIEHPISPNKRKKAIKDFFKQLDTDMAKSVSKGILPQKFVDINLKKFKSQATVEIRQSLKKLKTLKDLKNVKIGGIMKETGRILRNLQRQGKSYKHILLTNMLNKKKSINSRFLKRCKRLFSRQRSHSIFTKKAFYVLLVKMFFENNKDADISSYIKLQTQLKSYLETLEFFKFINQQETEDIIIHITSLINHFMKDSSNPSTFDLDKFFAFYSMILTKKDELNFETGEGLEDWPIAFTEKAESMVKNRESLKHFFDLQKMLKAYHDHKIEVQGKTNFLLKLGIKNHKELKAYLQRNFENALESIQDFHKDIKPLKYMMMKLLILMFTETEQTKRKNIRLRLSKIKDNVLELDIPNREKQKLRFFIKNLIQLYRVSQTGFKSHKKAQIFGFKLLDHLINVESPSLNKIIHNIIIPKRIIHKYIQYQMQNMLSVFKDLKADIPTEQTQALLVGLLKLLRTVSSKSYKETTASFKALLDNLNIVETPYTHFILDQLLKLGHSSLFFKTKQSSQTQMVKAFKDSVVEIEPELSKFLIQSKIVTKSDIISYIQKNIKTIAEKYRDYKILIANRTVFMIKSLLRLLANKQVSKKLNLQLFAEKFLDHYIFIEPSIKKFLITSLLKYKTSILASLAKKSSLNDVESKIRDDYIQVEKDTDFFVQSIINLLSRATIKSVKELKVQMVKIRDMHVNAFPGFSQFLIKSFLRIANAQLLMKKKSNLKLYAQKLMDRLITIPNIHIFMIKNVIKSNFTMKTYIQKQVNIAMQKIRDHHIPIEKQDIFLLKSLRGIISKFSFSSVSSEKLAVFLAKFKDEFIHPESPILFLLTALMNVATKSIQMRKKIRLNTVFSKFQDEFIQVEPNVAKFLLKADLSLTSKSYIKKMKSFAIFWDRFRDFFISPEPLDKFILSQILFQPDLISSEKIQSLNLKRAMIRDFYNLVEPNVQKFLLTSLFHFMKGVEFYNKKKLRIYLKSLVDQLVVPETQQTFLLDAFLGLVSNYMKKTSFSLTFQAQKFRDNYIGVDIPNKFLIKSTFSEDQVKKFKKIMSLRSNWKKVRDFLTSPLDQRKFLIYSHIFLNGHSTPSAKIKKNLNTLISAARDYYILVEPGVPKFIIQSLRSVLKDVEFYSKQKLKFALQKFVDNFIMPENQKIFLLQSLLTLSKQFIMKKENRIKINAQKMQDFYIQVETPGKFLLKSQIETFGKYLKKDIKYLKSFFGKMRDFFISPLNATQFVIWNLLMTNSLNSFKKSTNLQIMNKKIRDFHNLVEPNAFKFLLSAVLTVSKEFRFSNAKKLKFFLSRLLDRTILTHPEKQFMINSILNITASTFAQKKNLNLNTSFQKFMDTFVPIQAQNFKIRANLSLSQSIMSLHSLKEFKTKWKKFQDFFITPLNMTQFLITNIMFLPERISAKKLSELKIYQQAMRDYHVLVQPGFGKFLMNSLLSVLSNMKFHSLYKLNFFLSRFLDTLIIPENQKKFLLKAILDLVRPQFAINKKLHLKTIFSNFIDQKVNPEPQIQFLLKNDIAVSQDILAKRVQNFKSFWQRFQDFLIVPEALNKFLLTALVFTGQNLTSTEREQTLKNFGVRLRDYKVLVEPAIQKFILSNLFSLLQDTAFYNKSKLRLFLSKFVDGLIIPENQQKFLINSLFSFASQNFIAKKKIDIKTSFQRIIDSFIEPERQILFQIQSQNEILTQTQIQKFNEMKIQLKKMRDFFISPLTSMQFVIMSILFNPNDILMKKALSLKVFSTKLRDFHIIPDLSARKFLLTSLLETFTNIRSSSVKKLNIILHKLIDAFIIPENQKMFLIKAFQAIITDTFSAYKKFEFSTQFKQMADKFIEVVNQSKFLIKSDIKTESFISAKKVKHFKTFFQNIRDYLVVPISLNWTIYSLITFKGGDALALKEDFLNSSFQAVRDHHILIDSSFMMFMIKSVLEITQNISFANQKKLKFCLSHIIDSLIQVESVSKFLIQFFITIANINFSIHKKIELKSFLSSISDQKIDIDSQNFMIKSSIFTAMDNSFAQKINELKIFFSNFQDFLITPEPLISFVLKSLLSLEIPNISFLKSLDIKSYLQVIQDYHNLIDPNIISFILFALIETSSNFSFKKMSDLKVYLSRFLDNFVEVELLGGLGKPFLLTSLLSFFSEYCNIKTDSLKIMAQKYLDRYIEVQPENKFLITFLNNTELEAQMKKTLRVKFLYERLRDQHIEVENQIKFFINSFLSTHNIASATFMKDLKIFNRNTRDFLVQIESQNFMIKSLITGQSLTSFKKNSNLKILLSKFKDEHIVPELQLIFLLKNLITFFGDISFYSETQLKMFLHKIIDYHADIFSKNITSFMERFIIDNIQLRHNKMNFNPLINKIHLYWLKKPVKGLDIKNERHIYTKFLRMIHSNLNSSLKSQKLYYLKKAVKDISITNILGTKLKFTAQNKEAFNNNLFNTRMKYIHKKPGWGFSNKLKLSQSSINFAEENLNKVFSGSKIKPYVKTEKDRIESEATEIAVSGFASSEQKVFLHRMKLKAFALGESKGTKEHESETHIEIEKLPTPDDLSKSFLKELTHNAIKRFETEEEKYQVMFRQRHKLEDDIEKIELKSRQFNTVRRETAKKKYLESLGTSLKGLKDNLEKTVLKALKFEERPEAPKESEINSIRKALMTSLQKINNKLRKISKVVLKEVTLPIRQSEVLDLQTKLTQKPVFQKLKAAKSLKSFKKLILKIADEIPLKPNEIVEQSLHTFSEKIPNWLLSSQLKSPEALLKIVLNAGTKGGNKKTEKEVLPVSFKEHSKRNQLEKNISDGQLEEFSKVILSAGTKGGNKKTDKETLSVLAKLKKFLAAVIKEKNGARLDENGKIILFAPNKGGNKKTDKETILKNMISEMKTMAIKRRGQALDPEALSKIILKFVDHPPIGPKLRSAILRGATEHFSEAIKADTPQEFVKILLHNGTIPGNKKLDKEPHNYEFKAHLEVEKQIKKVKMVLEAAKKVLLKTDPWCCCCCDYFVTECCQETKEQEEWNGEEEYEGWGNDEIEYVKEAEQQMLAEGINPETHADEFEELVQRLEDADDFECKSGPRNMIYNILPDISFKLGLKTREGFDKELTETRDISNIVGDKPMYRIDGNFAEKLAKNNYLIDPNQIKPRRKNLYYQEPEYIRAERMNNFLEQQLAEEPDIDLGRPKKSFEVMDDFKGKDFHEEHEQIRNQRQSQYILTGDEGIDHFYQRMLKTAESLPKLDIGFGNDISKAQVEEEIGETVDKL